MKTKQSNESKLSFKAQLQRLQEITEELDREEIDLETAIALYEEGIGLSKTCMLQLKQAELKVLELRAHTDSSPENTQPSGETDEA